VPSARWNQCAAGIVGRAGTGAAGDAGGHMQDTVAERHDFTACQLVVVGEADKFAKASNPLPPWRFEPGRVGVKSVEGQVEQTDDFGLTDAVLDVPEARTHSERHGASSLARFSMNSSFCVSFIPLLTDAIPERGVLAPSCLR
jgi:hypothetical protein